MVPRNDRLPRPPGAGVVVEYRGGSRICGMVVSNPGFEVFVMSPGMIRPAAVAGMFYPAAPEVLRRAVYGLIEEARRRPGGTGALPKALVVPHAGYVYSGAVAASAYARLLPLAGRISRVVLLGPCHRVAVRGMVLPEADAFETPLGRIDIDQDAVRALAGDPDVLPGRAAHAADHAIEVQLPFLQRVLGEFRLLPLLVGDCAVHDVARVLERLWGGAETLIVISTDLSHYLPYPVAQREDRATVDAVLALADRIDHRHACGATPLNALLQVARRRGLTPELLDLRNSGDTEGDKSRVVGYASLTFSETQPLALSANADAAVQDDKIGARLTAIARAAIAGRFGVAMPVPGDDDFLRRPGASFVTLTLDGRLRGCIGSLAAHRPLGEDVRHNALAAAFADTRFAPLAAHEYDAVRIEVSLLSPATAILFGSEADLLARLRPRVDGIIFAHEGRRATFLPQVWESLPEPREFLAQLKAKAGLARDFWAPQVQVSRYTVQKWTE